MDEIKYATAFQNGYYLAQYEPELFKSIEPSLDRDDPLLHGKQQFEIDKAKEYFKKFERGDDKGKDKQKDIKPKM